ncbi:MAG: 4'-phosphopantetheinyl transferase family protein [Methanosarcinaceae archaeon]
MQTESLKAESQVVPEVSPITPDHTLPANMPCLWEQNDILIFLVDLEDYGTLSTECLDDMEMEGLERLKTGYFRKRYIISRMVLKYILCRILKGHSVSDMATYKDKCGKVHVSNHEELHVCISYTENIVVLAVSKFELGVDIEVKKKRSLANISKYLNTKTFQTDKSVNCLDLLTTWTLKEAYCKFSNKSIFSTFYRELDLNNVSYSSYIIDNEYILSLITSEGWHTINISLLEKIAFP